MNYSSEAAIVGIISGLMSFSPATAAPVDTSQIIAFTCKESGPDINRVERQRLATFILSDYGILSPNPQAWIEDAVNADESNTASDDQKAVLNTVAQLEEQLGKKSSIDPEELGLEARPSGPGRDRAWLFNEANVAIFCIKPKKTEPGTKTPNPDRKISFVLRRSPDDLPAIGDDRKTSKSALLAFKRERTRLDDGTRKTDSTLTIDGTIGISLGVPSDEDSAFLFATYNRQRVRTNPSPTLGIGESESDKDIDVLNIGFFGHSVSGFRPISFELQTSGSFISDFSKNSQRLRIGTRLIPSFGSAPLQICNLEEFSDPKTIGPIAFRTRCSITGMFEVSHVLKKGTAEFDPNNEFVLAGGRLGLELVPVGDSGVISSFFFQRQFRLAGTAPSIKNYSAFFGYRYWIGNDLGIDFGLDWKKGTNALSFDKEDQLTFSVGFIF